MKDTLVFYVHGKGGSAAEAWHYEELFPDCDIYGFDYKAETPWEAKEEFLSKVRELKSDYGKIILIANSIGAYFCMHTGLDAYVERAFFISPIVNPEKLILDMMGWAGVSCEELKEKKVIPVSFGDDLSWDYYQYVKEHPVSFKAPAKILYGSLDDLQSMETIRIFAEAFCIPVTVMEGGEHWFHTKEQMEFLDEWIRKE